MSAPQVPSAEPVEKRAIVEEEVRRQRLIRSYRRARYGFVLAALLLPGLFYALFERQARRLTALADHGALTMAHVAGQETSVGVDYTKYEYVIGGNSYTWTVGRKEVPYGVGVAIPITYLPEDPSLSRPGAARSNIRIEAASVLRFQYGTMLGSFGFVTLLGAISELKLRKIRRRESLLVSPLTAGRIVAVLILLCVIGTNFFGDVSALQRKAFGAAPFGLAVAAVVSIAETIAFIPFFWVFEHLMRIVIQAVRDRAGLSRGALAWYILRVHEKHPELARSRVIVLAGLGYFALIVGVWIAYAAGRGI